MTCALVPSSVSLASLAGNRGRGLAIGQMRAASANLIRIKAVHKATHHLLYVMSDNSFFHIRLSMSVACRVQPRISLYFAGCKLLTPPRALTLKVHWLPGMNRANSVASEVV